MELVSSLIKHKVAILTLLIILFAALLRFYHYDIRWGLAYDQSHDAIVAREALRQLKLPLLGPFSSAGAFVTGPEWYWFIMLATLPAPMFVITPWVVLTVLSIGLVYLMIVIGKRVGGNFLGLTAGLLTAVSSSQIAQSINLTNQAPLAILSAASIFFVVSFFQTKKITSLFWLGFFVALGVNTHLQGVLLIPLVGLPLLFEAFALFREKKTTKQNIAVLGKGIFFASIGFIIPFIPLIIFDTTHHFYDIRNMWQYYRYDQYKISLDVLGRNWRTYIDLFWPNAFAYIVGGNAIIAGGFSVISIFILILQCIKRKLPKTIVLLLIAFFISFVFMRYTRTPLFNSYLMYLHPSILLLSAWITTYVFRKNKIVGVATLAILVIGSLFVDISDIHAAQNVAERQVISWERLLSEKFPGKKITVYEYDYKATSLTAPLSLFLDVDGRTSETGINIGLFQATSSAILQYPLLTPKSEQYQLYDLSASSSAQLLHAGWKSVAPDSIYHETEEWYVDQKL